MPTLKKSSRELQLAKEIEKDVKTDIKAAKKIPRLPWRDLLYLIIVALPIMWLFDHFGKPELYSPVTASIVVLGFVLVLKWKWARRTWFWITMAVVIGLHVPLILFVPWPTRWVPAPVWAGLATIDMVVVLAIVDTVGRFLEVA